MVLDSPAFAICVMRVHTGGELSLLLQATKTQVTETHFLTSKYLNTIS